MENKIDELRSKVASLKNEGTILKVSNLAGKAFVLNVNATTQVTGNYGEQLLIVGTMTNGDEVGIEEGANARIYLNNKRMETFNACYTGEGNYGFVFGDSVELKNGYDYIPLDLVQKA
tara:strand:- start:3412 stop:3765 length:354 start_codon:yes stop_codon:yes gene_type:complete